MSTDYRAELQRLVEAYDEHGGKWPDHHEQALFQAVESARTALAQPEPVAPTDEELDELFTEIDQSGEALSWRAYARAVLARWGTPAIQPVPVSERPWEREGWLDAEGRCWMGHPGDAEFIPSWRLCRPEDAPSMTCSLPHHALPTP